MKLKNILIIFAFLIFILFYSYSLNFESYFQFTFFDQEIYNYIKSKEAINKIKIFTINRSNDFILKSIYNFDENGNVVKLLHYHGRSHKTPLTYLFEFNEKNEIIKITKDFDGSIDHVKEHFEQFYKREYNQEGKVAKLLINSNRTIINNNKEKKTDSYEIVEYIYQNNKIKQIVRTYGSTTTSPRNHIEKYDDNEKLLEVVYYSAENNYFGGHYYVYDNNGNLKKDKWIQFKKLYNLKDYEYNDDNKLISLTTYDKNEKLDFVVKYEYNENDQRFKSFSYDKKGKLYYINEYEYITNSNNETIKVIHKYGDPKKKELNITIYEYQYEYY